MSTTTKNIVIPGPVEGVIRSAQMADKTTPENSAQLGVNVNFDRIGDYITRFGTTAYSPGLSDSVVSLGYLLNQNTGDFWILAQQANLLYEWDGTGAFDELTSWSGGGKARYAQFLNLMYVVNGNASIGGMRCQTFNGSTYGDFNTGYIPAGSTAPIGTVSLAAGGSGYVVGDTLDVGGSGTGGQVYVTSVSGGTVTGIALIQNGTGYSVASGVATSGGTGSGATVNVTALLSAGLPAGDFISAGFDGRVWIADASVDTLYYSNVITNSIEPQVTTGTPEGTPCEFFNNFSPQDGETITALHRVPQALLLFKQNHIFRVYSGGLNGAYDKYPAFNVGTFSQESIIEAKDGVYFHHSSGFYRFNYNSYNSQPTEISRRVRDFVQAIPRSYYGSITGNYDGFDAVKWFIGPVTVEGVTYSNCCLRFSIATQVWTIYDYPVLTLTTAAINFDNGEVIAGLIGTSEGQIGIVDSGPTDFGEPIYFEYIDRWRSLTEMWSHSKDFTGMAAFSENAAGALLQYQIDKDAPDKWHEIGKYKASYTSLFPNLEVKDFTRFRTRTSGFTKGPQMIFDGLEVLTLQDKGYDEN